MDKEKSCGCIILKENKVLLIGARDDNGKLFWSFPKGHQEDEVEKAQWIQIDEAGKYFDGYYSDAWSELLSRLSK